MRRSVVQRPELLHRLASLSSRNRATAGEPKRRRFERQGFSRQERQGVTEDFRFGNCFERHASVGALSFHPESFRADEVELFDRGGEAAAAHLAAASPPRRAPIPRLASSEVLFAGHLILEECVGGLGLFLETR